MLHQMAVMVQRFSIGDCDSPDFGSIPNHRPIRLFSLKEKHVPHTDGDAASRTAGDTKYHKRDGIAADVVPLFFASKRYLLAIHQSSTTNAASSFSSSRRMRQRSQYLR